MKYILGFLLIFSWVLSVDAKRIICVCASITEGARTTYPETDSIPCTYR